MRNYALRIVLVAAMAFTVGCSMQLGPTEASLSGVPQGTWKVGILRDAESGERTIIAEIDSEKTLLSVLDIARSVIDGGTGVPVLGTIEVAGTTVGNLIQGFLKNLDPGPANKADGT